jgi:hypothetical protein
MHKKQLIGKKTRFYRGQLLLEDDFIAEQQYHARARRRHALNLHGSGVVRGLDVTAGGESTVTVNPGFAVDQEGHEIEIREAEPLDLSSFSPNALLSVTLAYEEEEPGGASATDQRINLYGVLRVAIAGAAHGVLLATVQLDERGRLGPSAISMANTQRLRTYITPGSVTATALDPQLRKGWLRLPFRPQHIPQDEKDARPPFRIGATQAVSHRKYPNEEPNTRGAAGTMAIPLPPLVTRVHRLRIAGVANEKPTRVHLFVGGWDIGESKHVKHRILEAEVGAGAPYDNIYDIKNGTMDPEYSTLSLDIRCDGYTAISLVAVEISY